MNVIIIGGSGFIGTALAKMLADDGCAVTVLTRGAAFGACGAGAVCRMTWDGYSSETLIPLLEGADAVVNLAGENIAAHRWTAARLADILFSRVRVGEAVRSACQTLHNNERSMPHVLVQASAVGYYGYWEDMDSAPSCDEHSTYGHGELAAVARQWEESSAGVAALGVRRCVMRFAPVLGRDGGMLTRLLPLFRMGLGGVAGSGRQPVSWVHVQDVAAAIRYVLWNKGCAGAYNVAAPEVVSMEYFTKMLGSALHRPVVLRIPAFMLRMALGGMATELILAGQVAVPRRLLNAGFLFSYPDLSSALAEVTGQERGTAAHGQNKTPCFRP